MTVAILGAGNVGRALAARLVAAEIPVQFGARDPARTGAGLPPDVASVRVLPQADAAAAADVIVLAVPATAALDALRAAGDLSRKIIVDATNPLRWDAGPVWTPPPEGSVAQAIARAFPAALVLKGFNTFGAEVHRDPRLASGPADAFFAGDDSEAKRQVMDLASRLGFRPQDAGPLRNAALLENLAVLWIHLAGPGGKGRQFAFRLDAR